MQPYPPLLTGSEMVLVGSIACALVNYVLGVDGGWCSPMTTPNPLLPFLRFPGPPTIEVLTLAWTMAAVTIEKLPLRPERTAHTKLHEVNIGGP